MRAAVDAMLREAVTTARSNRPYDRFSDENGAADQESIRRLCWRSAGPCLRR